MNKRKLSEKGSQNNIYNVVYLYNYLQKIEGVRCSFNELNLKRRRTENPNNDMRGTVYTIIHVL